MRVCQHGNACSPTAVSQARASACEAANRPAWTDPESAPVAAIPLAIKHPADAFGAALDLAAPVLVGLDDGRA